MLHYPETLRRYLHYRKKNDFVVIKYGAEWCGPCKEISPILIDLAKKYPNVYFLDVDIENEDILDHSDLDDVKKIPHIKFFLNGELKREIVGKDVPSLIKYVERYSNSELKNNETIKNEDRSGGIQDSKDLQN